MTERGAPLMGLEIRFLGPWEIAGDAGAVMIAGHRRIGVLARLALDTGQAVHADRLLSDVWGQSPAVTAAKQLHIVISKLRETLVPHGGAEIIQTVPGGYRLALDRDRIDAHLFDRLARRARTARAQGATAAADASFRQALGLWRGPALAGVTALWARVEATRLEEERLTVFEDHLDLRLAAGDHHAAAAELAAHVESHPLRERSAAQLMLALYRSSRISEALAVYQRTRRIMVEELGLEPGAELRRLHQAVLVKDPVLDLRTPKQEISVGEPIVPAEFPADTLVFTARALEVERLRAALGTDGGPPVTVIDGPGGIGKSALAVHVAHAVAGRFTDGVVYVNLHGSTAGRAPLTPIEALRHLLRSLGLDGTAVPADPDEAAARYRSLTATCNLLVILDNARDVRQVRPIIPAGHGCRVIVTSREPLTSLDNARHLHLGALADADADALLSRVAGLDRVRAEPEAAEEIVRLCGGFPLALRIVGARLAARPDGTLADLAARLADATRRLDTLEYGDQAVRAGIAVSHQHLHDEPTGGDAARLLTLLGLLDLPTHTPVATAALTGWPEHRAEAALEHLLDARLLEPAGPHRYQFHDLVGLYARERAHEDLAEEERAAAIRRALHHYLAALYMATPILNRDTVPRPPIEVPDATFKDAAEVGRWVEAERENLLAAAQQALAGADPATAVGLVIGLHWPFCYQGWHTQLADIYARAIEVADRIAAWEDKAQLRAFLTWAHRDQGRYEAATRQGELALADWDRAGLPRRKVAVLNHLGVIHTIEGRLDHALPYFEAALTLNADAGRPGATAALLTNRAHVYYRQGRFDEAIEEAREAMELWSQGGNHVGVGTAHDSLGDIYRHAGRLVEAVESYTVAVRLLQESGYRLGEAVSRWWLGTALHDLGRHGEARKQWEESVRLLREARLLTPGEAAALLSQPVPDTPEPVRNHL
ncbi:AfsR/SARP family transcriptional regulator [Nonomuraea sp. KM90]|uniref:AfsR/SARP family transcriptional regulator n=1 Tax=Nonomuraea sp. KM90 TaxID=3457428 RepID=UPI003FCD27A7